jgi:hypothetical protein
MAISTWRLLQRPVLGSEADHHALVGVGQRAGGVQIARVWQGFQRREPEHLAALAANPRLEQLVPPLVLARRLARAGNGHVRFLGLPRFIQRQHRRERYRLDRERPRDAQLVSRHRGLVVEHLLIRVRRDGGIHLPLHGLPGFVEGIESRTRGSRPVLGKVERHFPFEERPRRRLFARGEIHGLACGGLEVDLLALATAFRHGEQRGRGFAQGLIEAIERGHDFGVAFLEDLVDLGIVGDGLQGHVRHGLVDESALQALVRILQLIVVVAGGHQALLGQGHGHARGVARDPAAAPFLGHESRRAGTAGGIEDQIAGVGGHEDAAFKNLFSCLNYIGELCSDLDRLPSVVYRNDRKISDKSAVAQLLPFLLKPRRETEHSETGGGCFPVARLGAFKFLAVPEVRSLLFLPGAVAKQALHAVPLCHWQRLRTSNFLRSHSARNPGRGLDSIVPVERCVACSPFDE